MPSKDTHFLGNEPTGKLLLKLSIPAGVGMIVNALYNLTDAIFVGHGAGSLALAGLSIAFPIQLLASTFAVTIGIGAAALMSIRMGEKKPEEAAKYAATAISSTVVIGFILLLVIHYYLIPILKVFGATDTILPFASQYIGTVLWGFPLITSLITGNNLLRSVGKAKASMMVMVLGTGLNIILDPILIFPKGEFIIGYFGLGIKGAAIATVISQFVAICYLLYLYLNNALNLPFKKVGLYPEIKKLGQIFLLGLSAFIRNGGSSILVVIVNNSLKHYGGDLAISSYGIIIRVLMFTLMPIFGVIQGFQPIAGYNYGAKYYQRLKKVTYQAIVASTIISSMSFVLMFFFPFHLLRLFTSDDVLIQQTASFLRIVVIAFPTLGFQFVGSTFFQAIDKKVPSLMLGISRQFLLLPPLILTLPIFLQLNGIWFAFPTADTLALIITFFALRKELNRLFN